MPFRSFRSQSWRRAMKRTTRDMRYSERTSVPGCEASGIGRHLSAARTVPTTRAPSASLSCPVDDHESPSASPLATSTRSRSRMPIVTGWRARRAASSTTHTRPSDSRGRRDEQDAVLLRRDDVHLGAHAAAQSRRRRVEANLGEERLPLAVCVGQHLEDAPAEDLLRERVEADGDLRGRPRRSRPSRTRAMSASSTASSRTRFAVSPILKSGLVHADDLAHLDVLRSTTPSSGERTSVSATRDGERLHLRRLPRGVGREIDPQRALLGLVRGERSPRAAATRARADRARPGDSAGRGQLLEPPEILARGAELGLDRFRLRPERRDLGRVGARLRRGRGEVGLAALEIEGRRPGCRSGRGDRPS